VEKETVLKQLFSALSSGDISQELGLVCQRDYAPLRSLVQDMIDLIVILIDAARKVLNIIDCENIVPIYTDLVYRASCQYSARAMAWVLSSCIIMGTFGMIMITLRSSYKLNQYTIKQQDELVAALSNDEFHEKGVANEERRRNSNLDMNAQHVDDT
jgi:hypothetical protein